MNKINLTGFFSKFKKPNFNSYNKDKKIVVERISKHISYVGAIKSQTAIRNNIDNRPNKTQLENMILIAENCFEPLRNWHGRRIGISSFLRVSELNRRIGSLDTSQHLAGELSGWEEAAIDIDADIYNNGISNLEIFNWLKNNVTFDKLINEYPDDDFNPSWVHISYRKNNNRKILLLCKKEKGEIIYTRWEV